MLSIKGREPFIRMQLWLNDTNNIEKLQTLKNERREANKRRRNHIDDSLSYKQFDNQLFNLSNNFNMTSSIGKGLLGSSGPFPMSNISSQPQVKKARILFTEEQKEALRIAFAMDPYPSSSTAEFLAKELSLSIRTITNWFHNHRMRLKQINTNAGNNGEESNPTPIPYNIGRDNISFDQSQFRSLLSKRIAELKLRANNPNNSSNGSSNNNNNQFGSYNQNSSSSPPQHRFKYSSSMYQPQSVYSNNTNSCSSPGSSSPFAEEEEMGTLDLSMSSHNQRSSDKLDSTGRSSVQDDSDDGCRSGEEEEDGSESEKPATKKQGSSRRKPQHVMSSSSRRKAAQPQQWVAPAIDTSAMFAEDDYAEEDEYEEDRNSDDGEGGQHQPTGDIMNGAFAQQMTRTKSSKSPEVEANNDTDDQKTDDSDDDHSIQEPPYQKLKSSNTVMNTNKLAINEDSSNNLLQECVQ